MQISLNSFIFQSIAIQESICMYISMHAQRKVYILQQDQLHKHYIATVVWEIFIWDNFAVKFIRDVMFSWVSCTHENVLLLNFVHIE